MRYIHSLILLCIILFVSVASADIIDELFGTKYIYSVDELKYDGMYIPDEVVQSSQHIRGWIDVVGYKNITCIDGKYYIPGDSVNNSIVLYQTWDEGLFWNDNFDWIKIDDVRIAKDGNITTAEIDIHLKWHHSSLGTTSTGKSYVKKTYYDEYATFSDTDITPQTYPALNYSNTSIDVVIYNNTISPKTTIKALNIPENILLINYSYNNETIIHYHGIATQKYTETNCPYMNISSADIWSDGGNLSHMNGFVIIPSMNFSTNNLTITLNDPYSITEIDNITIYELKWHGANDTFSSLFWIFISIIGMFVIGSYYQIRRFRCL